MYLFQVDSRHQNECFRRLLDFNRRSDSGVIVGTGISDLFAANGCFPDLMAKLSLSQFYSFFSEFSEAFGGRVLRQVKQQGVGWLLPERQRSGLWRHPCLASGSNILLNASIQLFNRATFVTWIVDRLELWEPSAWPQLAPLIIVCGSCNWHIWAPLLKLKKAMQVTNAFLELLIISNRSSKFALNN